MTTPADAPIAEDDSTSIVEGAHEAVSEEEDSSEAPPMDDPTALYAPKGEKRKKRHLQRRAEMLDTAMELVLAEGIESLTVARLAKKLGSAVGALYRYFPGKEDLIVALQSRSIASYFAALNRSLSRFDDDTKAEVANNSISQAERLIARALVGLHLYKCRSQEAPEHHQLLDSLMSEPRGVLNDAQLADINQSISPIIKTCADLLDDAVEAGVLQAGDNLQRVYLVWGSVHGLLHFKKRDRANPAANLRSDALLKFFFQTLFSAWGADEVVFEAAFARVVTERETPLCVG